MLPLRDDNPTRTVPFVTIGLLFLNVLAFLYQLTYGPHFPLSIHRLGLVPVELVYGLEVGPAAAAVPAPLTVLTSMFLHGGVLHLLGNLLFLWIFGNNVEDTLGHVPFAALYLLWGVAAAAAQVLVDPRSAIPMVGASGAVSGVLGAYLVFFPWARVRVLIFLIFYATLVRIPAVTFLGIWFVFQLLGVGTSGVAWYAHIGGFLAGLVVALIVRGWRRGRRRKRPRELPGPEPAAET
jgi:membrane associated rhomboid family serine protease